MVQQEQGANEIVGQLVEQHEQIIAIINNLSQLVDGIENHRQASKAKDLLKELSHLLDIHLKVEDKLLYPVLKKSENEKIKSAAKAYSAEMGDLYKEVNAFMHKWTTSSFIAAQPEEFKKETGPLVWALLKRVDRENNELFPLLKEESE